MPEKPTKPLTADAKARLVGQLKKLFDARQQDLAWYHAVGRHVLQLVPTGEYGRGTIQKLAKKIENKTNLTSFLYATREFAGAYDQSEITALKNLGWVQVRALSSIEDQELRARLQQECMDKGLSSRALNLLIQERVGKRGKGGRQPQKAAKLGPKSALREVKRLTDEWLRSCPTWLDQNKAKIARLAGKTDNAELQELLADVTTALAELRKAAEEQRRMLKRMGGGLRRGAG